MGGGRGDGWGSCRGGWVLNAGCAGWREGGVRAPLCGGGSDSGQGRMVRAVASGYAAVAQLSHIRTAVNATRRVNSAALSGIVLRAMPYVCRPTPSVCQRDSIRCKVEFSRWNFVLHGRVGYFHFSANQGSSQGKYSDFL